MKQLHIVCLIQSLGIGGAEQSLVNLINHADPKRFRFTVIIFDDIRSIVSRIQRTDVQILHVPKRGKISLHLIRDLVKVFKKIKPDVVHTHLFTADVWGTIAANKMHIPTVLTEHGFNTEYGFLRTFLKRRVANKSTVYVACSEAVRQHMWSVYHITKPITVIENGIEIKQFSNIPDPSLVEPFKLCIIGRLSKEKGQAVAFEALDKLSDYRWQLSVVGEGVLRSDLETFAKKLSVANRISFTGVTHNVSEVLSTHDIVLVPSLSEGLSTVAREAMAAGRLVVASDVGGLSEFIEHQKNGWLVEANNPNALAGELRDIFTNPNQARHAGHAARRAASQFAVEKMVEHYSEVYRSIV